MKTLDNYLNNQLNDKAFSDEYHNLQPELDIIRALIDARSSKNMTQFDLAKATGIHQADISKIENGTRNPSLKMLKRLANGMNMRLELRFIPK